MKLKKTILGMAVVAVAGVNVFNASGAFHVNGDMSLAMLEQLADAGDCYINEWNPATREQGIGLVRDAE